MAVDEPQTGAADLDTDVRICRLFDRRVLPLICCLYLCSYLDRGNIGNAKTASAHHALALDSAQWAWVLNSLYICYIIFDWTTMLWKIFPAHAFISLLCVCWGAAAMSSGAVHSMAQLVTTRCLLGIFEAIFGCGAPYFLSLLYKRRELALRIAFLLGMMPLANTFSSSLAYAITHIRGSLAPWRLLFVIDSPATARFLTAQEQRRAVERLQLKDTTTKEEVKWQQVLADFYDYKNYVYAVIHFCANFSFAALSNFLPTIIRDMGYDDISAQGLTAPAYLAAFLLSILISHLSDRLARRGPAVAGTASLAAVGYGLLSSIRDRKKTGLRYAGAWLAACGMFPALSLNVTLLLNNQGGDSKKGDGLAIFLTLGQCSSLVSSVVFSQGDAPFYSRGCAIGCGLSGIMVLLGLGWPAFCLGQ